MTTPPPKYRLTQAGLARLAGDSIGQLCHVLAENKEDGVDELYIKNALASTARLPQTEDNRGAREEHAELAEHLGARLAALQVDGLAVLVAPAAAVVETASLPAAPGTPPTAAAEV